MDSEPTEMDLEELEKDKEIRALAEDNERLGEELHDLRKDFPESEMLQLEISLSRLTGYVAQYHKVKREFDLEKEKRLLAEKELMEQMAKNVDFAEFVKQKIGCVVGSLVFPAFGRSLLEEVSSKCNEVIEPQKE